MQIETTDWAGITRGDRFEHARQLDTTWKPGPGQRYADAPHVIMEVSRVVRGVNPDDSATWIVYYRPAGTTGAGFVTELATLPVRRWLP